MRVSAQSRNNHGPPPSKNGLSTASLADPITNRVIGAAPQGRPDNAKWWRGTSQYNPSMVGLHDGRNRASLDAGVITIEIDSPTYGLKLILLDEGDWDAVRGLRWCVQRGRDTFYARANVRPDQRQTPAYMHRLVLGLPPGSALEIDHIDHDGLDNRREAPPGGRRR